VFNALSYVSYAHGIAICGLILVVALGAAPGTWTRRFFEHPLLVLLGKLSYGLYVYHYLFLPLMVRVFLVHGMWRVSRSLVTVPIFIVVAMVMSLGIAWASWNVLEKPCLKLKRYFEYKPG